MLICYTFLQAKDLKYLNFSTIEIPKTLYLMFQDAGMLKSREELWEIRKHQILTELPDPLAASLSAEEKDGFEKMRIEVETVCKKYVKEGQIVFREWPPGNEHVLRGFTTHFVVDSRIVCNPEEVHKKLAAMGLSNRCQPPCQCHRILLSISMADALSHQKDGPSKESIMQDMLGNYILATSYQVVLPKAIPSSNPPSSSQPSNASASAAVAPATASAHGVNVGNQASNAATSVGIRVGRPQAAFNTVGGSSIDGSTTPGNQAGMLSMGASVGRPQAVKVVQERETPVTPGIHDPLLFHNGIQAALASVLKHSAGQHCAQGVIRSCNHPSLDGAADTVTVRLCPNKSKNPLRASNVQLISCVVPSNAKLLYLPESFDFSGWSQAKSDAAQRLYELLERLHELIQPGVAPVNLYYDANDGCIAFNRGNMLWYNAYADHVYEQSPQGVRLFNWYITVCHELAHNFRHEHDEVFSDYLAHIALQHSRAFYALCDRYQVSI